MDRNQHRIEQNNPTPDNELLLQLSGVDWQNAFAKAKNNTANEQQITNKHQSWNIIPLRLSNDQFAIKADYKFGAPESVDPMNSAELLKRWQCTHAIDMKGKETIEHKLNKKTVECWTLSRDSNRRIVNVETMTPDPKPEREGLCHSRTRLIAALENNFQNPEQRQSLFMATQQLEQQAREGKFGNDLKLIRTELSARYTHIANLVEANFPVDAIKEALRGTAQTTLGSYDASGVYDADMKRDPQVNDGREIELWHSQETKTNDKSLITHTLNGSNIESWLINKSDDGSSIVKPIIYPDVQPDKEGLDKARSNLITAIYASNLQPHERLAIMRDLAHIEHRARQGEMGKDIVALRKEVADVYKQLHRMMTDKSPVPVEHKLIAARQLAHELADTQDIDQGTASDACRVSAVQGRLAVMRPSVVARVVADALLDGKVRFGNPEQVITLDAESRKPASKHCLAIPLKHDERSFASQLFQLASMNALGQDPVVAREHMAFMRQWNKNAPAGEFVKLQFEQQAEIGTRSDKGEVYKNNNGLHVFGVRKDGTRVDFTTPGVSAEGTNQPLFQLCSSQKLLDMLDPGRHKGAVIVSSSLTDYVRSNFSGEANNDQRGVITFETEEDLQKLVQKADGPLIIGTHDRTPDPGEEPQDLPKTLCNHVITIRKFVPAERDAAQKITRPAYFVTDDSFGKSYDSRRLYGTALKEKLSLR